MSKKHNIFIHRHNLIFSFDQLYFVSKSLKYDFNKLRPFLSDR